MPGIADTTTNFLKDTGIWNIAQLPKSAPLLTNRIIPILSHIIRNRTYRFQTHRPNNMHNPVPNRL